MESECPVLLNVCVSFAPTPSTPPRLGETTHKRLIQPYSCRQQHPLKFLEDISEGYCVLWEDGGPDAEVVRHSLIEAVWTLPERTDYLGGQLSQLLCMSKKGQPTSPPKYIQIFPNLLLL